MRGVPVSHHCQCIRTLLNTVSGGHGGLASDPSNQSASAVVGKGGRRRKGGVDLTVAWAVCGLADMTGVSKVDIQTGMHQSPPDRRLTAEKKASKEGTGVDAVLLWTAPSGPGLPIRISIFCGYWYIPVKRVNRMCMNVDGGERLERVSQS